MSSALQPIARALTLAFSPLRQALEDSTGTRLRILVRELGWDVALAGHMDALPLVRDLPPLIDAAQATVAELSAIAARGGDLGGAVAAVLDLVLGEGGIVETLEGLENDLPLGAGLPAILQDGAFWRDFALDLPEYLLIRYLEVHQPAIFAPVRLLGFVEVAKQTRRDAFAGNGKTYTRRTLHLTRMFEMVDDPVDYVRQLYRWTGSSRTASTFDSGASRALLDDLSAVLRGMGVSARHGPIRDRFVGPGELVGDTSEATGKVRELALPLVSGRFEGVSGFVEQGIVVFPIPASPGDEEVAGLYLGNLGSGLVEVPVRLSRSWQLTVTGSLDATGAFGIVLYPGEYPSARTDAGVSGAFELAVGTRPGEGPWRIFGGEAGTRLMCGGAEASVALRLEDGVPDVELGLRTLSSAGVDGLTFVIEPGEGDAFVAELLGTAPIEAGIDGSMTWSARSGFRFEGGAGLELTVPINQALGPVYLDAITVGLEIGTDGLSVEAGLSASAALGPFVLVVDGVGLRTELSDAGDGRAIARFGDLAVGIDFKPPDGVGVALDAGVASGGGYLYFDRDEDQYSGIVQIEFLTFGLTAIGILNTELPDGSPGWALLLSISTEMPPLPLGFGFTLNGVGGLMAVHRTMDTDVLAASITDGSIDWILFPDDPIAQAPAILAGLDAAFPIRKGSFVLGPMVQIGWGVPTIVEISAGILVTLPDPIEIAIIGQLDVVLGTDEVALVELHVDLLGIVDLEEGALSIFANVRDSHVVGLPLRGSMAFVADFVGNPYFLVSFGGFHPDYLPPVPLPFDMARMGFGLDMDQIQVTLGSYFAVTSNAVQFGCEFSIVAKALGFTAEGALYFHVLFLFDPFRLRANVGFTVSVSAGTWQLLAVELDLTVTGPNRWEGVGTASFKFLLKGIDFKVEGAFGKKKATTPLEKVDVAGKLLAALEEPEAWAGLAPAGTAVRLREVPTTLESEEGEQTGEPIHWVWPDGRVEIKQTVAPLDVRLDRFGSAEIKGTDTVSITAPTLGGTSYETSAERLDDFFAPAEFFDLSRADKLSTPAFQLMEAGIEFGGEGVSVGKAIDVEMGYEEWQWSDRDAEPRAARAPVPAAAAHLSRGLAGSLAAGLAARRAGGGRFRRASGEVAVDPEAFVVADVDTANTDTAITPRAGVREIEAVLARKRLDDQAAQPTRVVLPVSEAGRNAA